ncbi:MAG: DUF885 family protein [Acidobacteriota bacterium]
MRDHLRSRASVAVATIIIVPVLAIAVSCGGDQAPAGRRSASSVLLQQLGDELWQHQVAESPLLRLREGLEVTSLPDISYQSAEQDAEFDRSILRRLEEVDAAELSHEEMLTSEVMRWELQNQIDGLRFFWLSSVLTPYSSPLPDLKSIYTSYAFAAADDLARYLDLMHQYAGLVDALLAHAKDQLEHGIVTPKANMNAVVGLVRSGMQAPDESFFQVGDERLASLALPTSTSASSSDGGLIEEFHQQVAAIIESEINPALQRLAEYLDGPYRRQASDRVGTWQYPEGKEFYRYLTRLHTTMEVTPEEVHQVGLEMVGSLQEKMAEIRASVNFEGSAEEFHEFLRTDKKFFPATADEVGERLKAAADAMFARIDSLFLKRPQAPYAVRRLDPALEASMTYGYYDVPTAADPAGYYNYNGSHLDQRSWINLESVAFHELVPGHHFQLALQFENKALPEFRRNARQNAFTEGWAVYASNLGLEAGLFEDPYSRYGHYGLDIFLTTRLVVDTGMNYFEWPLERGRQFMRDYTLESPTQIDSESLRYSTDMPGQALAYQMGRRKIQQLREKAAAALGDKFDLRRFHDAVIGSGSLPMSVLAKHIDWFIEQELQE